MRKFLASLGTGALVAVGLFVGQGAMTASAGLTCARGNHCYSVGGTTETEAVTGESLLYTLPTLNVGDAHHMNETIWLTVYNASTLHWDLLEMGICKATDGSCSVNGNTYIYAAINGGAIAGGQSAFIGPPGAGTTRTEKIYYNGTTHRWEFSDTRNGVTTVLNLSDSTATTSTSGSQMSPQVGLEIETGTNGLNSTQSEANNGSHAYLLHYGGQQYVEYIAADRQYFNDNECGVGGVTSNCFFGSWNGNYSQWIHGKQS